ncbi:7-cyano-7-deazaguanine synthase QueC, partial [Candidatus Magnetobacterium casensis]|nr:7-cyano-7-deazaguanine synthase QueC [Candidatus Magnetobacterium casensis]
SGGQDSATCLAWAKQKYQQVEAITFNYGQRHAVQENRCAYQLAELADVRLTMQPMAVPQAPSALTGGGPISLSHPVNPNLPASFLPGRNYLLLGYAAAYAYGQGIHNLIIGVSQTDYSGYPDCRSKTIAHIESALDYALDYCITIEAPLLHLSKAQTVRLMKQLGKLGWYMWTHTCYEGQRPPCGECPACVLRAKGFQEAREQDPLTLLLEEEAQTNVQSIRRRPNDGKKPSRSRKRS